MAKQNRTTLKNYFQTGDKPSQAQYADLIDSKVNLSESNTGDITLVGNISSSTFHGNSLTLKTFLKLDHPTDAIYFGEPSSDTIVLTSPTQQTFRISVGDDLNDSYADIGIQGLAIPLSLMHMGDSNTKLSFATDKITLTAGGVDFITMTEDTSDTLVFGNVQTTFGGHITASGNISASGNMIAETGSFDNGVILKAPNGNQFRFTINNSGHLSLTGSAI